MNTYQKTKGWWTYIIKTPNNMYYSGYGGGRNGTEQPLKRWQPLLYKGTGLYTYIEKFGWENLEKIVLTDGLTKEDAKIWEDKMICMYTKLGCCVNQRRSGNISKNKKEYSRVYEENRKTEKSEYNYKYYRDHQEGRIAYHRKHNKERLSKPEGKIYNRVNAYNRTHTPIETPLEAKQKYLESGYIPNYIKNNDLY